MARRMERESTKHGPARDEELKHESEVPDSGEPEDQEAEEIALRSELARLLTRDEFPADRDTLLARLAVGRARRSGHRAKPGPPLRQRA
jgi:hypothetical protein